MYISEYSGLATSSSFDDKNGNNGGSTPYTTNLTTAVANELIVGFAWDGTTTPPGSPWNNRSTYNDNSRDDRNGATATNYTYSGAATTAWIAMIAAFKEPGGTAAVTGTATASITEADVVAGNKQIVITISGDTWIAS